MGHKRKTNAANLLRWSLAGIAIGGLLWVIDVLSAGITVAAGQAAKRLIPGAYTFLGYLHLTTMVEIGLVAFLLGLSLRVRRNSVILGSLVFICIDRATLWYVNPYVVGSLPFWFITGALLTLGACVGFAFFGCGSLLRKKSICSDGKGG
jgi:hypothetical protein